MHNTWYYCLYCGTICTYLVYTAVYACMPVSIDRPVGADDTLMSPKSINNLDGRTTTTWSKIIKTCYYHLYTAVNRQSVSLTNQKYLLENVMKKAQPPVALFFGSLSCGFGLGTRSRNREAPQTTEEFSRKTCPARGPIRYEHE